MQSGKYLNLDRRNRPVQFGEFGRRESNGCRAEVLDRVRHLCRAGNRHDPRLLCQEPRQRDLGRSGLFRHGPDFEKMDAIGAEALEHTLDGQLDITGAAVESRTPQACFEIDVPAELGCDRDPISERSHAFAQDSFHLMRPVSLRRVVKGDAPVKGCPKMLTISDPVGMVC